LFVQNTSPGRLQMEAALGGSPMPSLAVTREGIPFNNFGEITLVGKPSRFDPRDKRNVVYSADAYTTRQPEMVRQSRPNAYELARDRYDPYKNSEVGFGLDSLIYDLNALSYKGDLNPGNFRSANRYFEGNYSAPRARFLEGKGIDIRDADGNVSREKMLDQSNLGVDLEREYENFVAAEKDDLFFPDQYFVAKPQRYLNDGRISRAQIKDYTAENILRFMRRRRGQNKETGLGQTSVAAQRASESKQLRSMQDIKDRRDSILGEEARSPIFQANEGMFFELAEQLKPFYQFDASGMRYLDEVGEAITEMSDANTSRVLDKFGFQDVSPEMIQKISTYRKNLSESPVGYLEAKPERIVQLDDFAGAVVPDRYMDMDSETVDLLRDSGLEVKRYNPDSPQTRTVQRDKFKDQMFSVGGLGLSTIAGAAALSPRPAEAGFLKRGIDAGNDVVKGDIVEFKQDVFGGSYKRPTYLGQRTVHGEVLRESYGADKQQHTFTIKPLNVEGVNADELLKKDSFRIKGRNLYKNGVLREMSDDEAARKLVADEKHERGAAAREARDIRKGMAGVGGAAIVTGSDDADAGALSAATRAAIRPQSSVSKFWDTFQETIGGTRGLADTLLMGAAVVPGPQQIPAAAIELGLLATDAVDYMMDPNSYPDHPSTRGRMNQARRR